MDPDEILELLGLDDTAEPDAIVAALAEADDEPAGELAALMEDFADESQFVGWLASEIGVPVDDLAALAQALVDAGVVEPSEEGEEEGEASMQDDEGDTVANQQNGAGGDSEPTTVVALSQQLTELREEHTEALERLANLEGERATEAAEAQVDRAIDAGKFVPAQRDVLVTLAKHSPERFSELADSQPEVVSLRERGSSADGNAAEFEPSEDEVNVAMKMGYSRKEATQLLRQEKRAAAGLEPEDDEGEDD